ncbi:hypothetical protein BpHYR1_039601 [Brachionus plicatilis]|uniref:Uncharacterized protein n=1 Tax=Brachionus plicatilis TaxID=10195 RepID=A0A3M7QNI2_BRAPC|nr:hypothetical protein BpHYR1_039601 [Brachionus plicatilis]
MDYVIAKDASVLFGDDLPGKNGSSFVDATLGHFYEFFSQPSIVIKRNHDRQLSQWSLKPPFHVGNHIIDIQASFQSSGFIILIKQSLNRHFKIRMKNS